jgi:hypothetical protein
MELHQIKRYDPDPDPHQSDELDPDPPVIGWIWSRIILQVTSPNVWNMSIFEHFLKVFSLFWKLGSGSASK